MDFMSTDFFPYYKIFYIEILLKYLFPNSDFEYLEEYRKKTNKFLFDKHSIISYNRPSFEYKINSIISDEIISFIGASFEK